MDRNFYLQKRANEHQHEISQALANQHLLKTFGQESLTQKQARRLVLRFAPVVIVTAILLLIALNI